MRLFRKQNVLVHFRFGYNEIGKMSPIVGKYDVRSPENCDGTYVERDRLVRKFSEVRQKLKKEAKKGQEAHDKAVDNAVLQFKNLDLPDFHFKEMSEAVREGSAFFPIEAYPNYDIGLNCCRFNIGMNLSYDWLAHKRGNILIAVQLFIAHVGAYALTQRSRHRKVVESLKDYGKKLIDAYPELGKKDEIRVVARYNFINEPIFDLAKKEFEGSGKVAVECSFDLPRPDWKENGGLYLRESMLGRVPLGWEEIAKAGKKRMDAIAQGAYSDMAVNFAVRERDEKEKPAAEILAKRKDEVIWAFDMVLNDQIDMSMLPEYPPQVFDKVWSTC